ncbi:molybdopterin converting factor subunit 1 [Virgibacillus siamensis]|uniref:molybdopterin converting factor subunit 1 n=1 Tax=Virgibacillus siamensis TaxID=480071 RepID=UPI0009861DE2|nr:molybdopterin converting factor subunit 1 [Virgibacillus siamensis]
MVDVLFFAELQETVGNNKVEVDADGLTLAELKGNLLNMYKLNQLDQAMIAVNEEYAQEDVVLKSGDVVAFIPPVSGG